MAKRKCKRYYYVPSTYKGRKFKRKGKSGGAYRGCGRICGGSLDDLVPMSVAQALPAVAAAEPVDIPVAPVQVEENILGFPKITDEMIERARQVIALAEATGKVQPITKKEAGIWSGLKNFGSKVWRGVKKVASNPYVQTIGKAAIPLALGAMMPYAPGAVQAAYKYGVKALNSGERKLYNHLDRKFNPEEYEYYGDDDQGESVVNPRTGKTVAEEMGTETLGEKMADAVTPNSFITGVKNLGNMMQNTYNAGKEWLGSHIPIRFSWRKASGYGGAYRAGAYRAGAYRGAGRKGRLKKGSPEAKAYMAMLRRMRGKKRGKGIGGAYRGCGHLRKGSPEAKAYMAMLRRMRGRKRSSKRGGMFKGVTEEALQNIYKNNAHRNGDEIVPINWRDKNGQMRTTDTTVDSIRRMLEGTENIRNFYMLDENGKIRTEDEETAFRSDFLSNHHGDNWPYKKMGVRRENKLQRQLNSLNKNYTRAKMRRAKAYWKKRATEGLYKYLRKKLKKEGGRKKSQNYLLNKFFPNGGKKHKLNRLRKLNE